MTESEADLAELLGRMRLLAMDHDPDGWPAVRMRDITALCDAIVQLNTSASVQVKLGEVLFCFESEIRWANKAKSWYATCSVPPHRTIAIDAKGRICVSGREFMRATTDGAYPVVVYEIQ